MVDRAAPSCRVLHVTQAAATGVIRHLVTLTSPEATGGIEHHAVLPRADVALGLGAVFDERAADRLRANGVTLCHIDMRRTPLHPANLSAVPSLRRLIGRLRPDVVHAHSSIAGVTARLAAARTGIPVVYTPHGLGATSRPVPRFTERILRRLTTVMVAVSDSEKQKALVLGLEPRGGVTVIPNGITAGVAWDSPRPCDPRDLLGVPAGAPLVAMVARLAYPKEPVLFARACAEVARSVPAAHFLLVGSGPLQAELDQWLTSPEGLALSGRWHQIDEVPDAAALMRYLDVLVLCSSSEGCPYAPLEAMAAGTPVVLTAVVGNRDVVEHGVSGLLAPLGDAAAIGAAVARILAQPSLHAELSDGGRRRVAERFSVEAMGRAYAELYRQLAAG